MTSTPFSRWLSPELPGVPLRPACHHVRGQSRNPSCTGCTASPSGLPPNLDSTRVQTCWRRTRRIAAGRFFIRSRITPLAVRVVAKDEFTEVLIPGQHDIALGLGFRQQIGVGRLLAGLGRVEDVNALPPLKVVQLLGNACLSPTTLAPKGPFRPRGPRWIRWFSLDSVEPHRVTSNDLVGALGAIPAAWWRTSHDVLARLMFSSRADSFSPANRLHPH